MKNEFINRVLGETTTDYKLKDEFNSKQSFRFTITALVITVLIWVSSILLIKLEKKDSDYFLYSIVGCLVLFIILFSLILCDKRRTRAHKVIKWIIFIVYYLLHVSWTLYVIIDTEDLPRQIRHILLLYITSGIYLVILLKMSFACIISVGIINLSINIYLQIRHWNDYFYVLELTVGIITPLACIVIRGQYERMIQTIFDQMKDQEKSLNYIEMLIDQLPSSLFLIYSAGDVVYLNQTAKEFAQEHSSNTTSTITSRVIQQTENANLNETNFYGEKFKIKDLLEKSKFCYFDANFKKFVGNSQSNNLNTVFDSVDEQNITPNDFHFIGMSSYISNKTQRKFYHQVYLRKLRVKSTTWIECIMNDVTQTQNTQEKNKFYSKRESILSKIAHEFKIPLMCIAHLSEDIQSIIRERTGFDGIQNKIAHVNDLSNFTLCLTNDIMNYLSDNNSQISLKFEKFKVSEILYFSHRILVTLLTYYRQRINYIIPILESSSDYEISSDKLRLKQIIINFISNAVKFTKSGFIKIKSLKIGRDVRISVEDTGMGIKEQDVGQLFYQEKMLKEHIGDNQVGSGVGLSVTNNLAMLLKSKVGVKSEYEVGSTFYIDIPLDNGIETFNSSPRRQSNHSKTFAPFNSNLTEEHYIELNSRNPHTRTYSGLITPNSFENNILSCFAPQKNNSNVNTRIIERQDTDTENSVVTILYDQPIVFMNNSNCLNKYSFVIVDDTPFLLHSFEDTLKNALKKLEIQDYNIIKGADGIDLIKFISEDQKNGNKIICSFVDENMEYLNGGEAIEIIRKLEHKKKIKKQKICKISAAENSKKSEDFTLTKPVSISELQEILRSLLNI